MIDLHFLIRNYLQIFLIRLFLKLSEYILCAT